MLGRCTSGSSSTKRSTVDLLLYLTNEQPTNQLTLIIEVDVGVKGDGGREFTVATGDDPRSRLRRVGVNLVPVAVSILVIDIILTAEQEQEQEQEHSE